MGIVTGEDDYNTFNRIYKIMSSFGIFSPGMGGKRSNIPSILLSSAYLPDSQNARVKNGEIWRENLRIKEIVESEYSTGTVDVTDGSKTVNGNGTAWHAGMNGRAITIDEVDYEIDSVSAVNVLTLTENHSGNGIELDYSIGTALTKVPTPDGNPVLRYHTLLKSTGDEFLFAFTKEHAYLWETGTSAWRLKWTNSSDCDSWDTAEINDQIIATNNVDPPLVWGSSPANDFDELDSDGNGPEYSAGKYIDKAKFVTVFENSVFFGCTTEDGTLRPNRVRWCEFGDETTWDSGNAGYADIAGKGQIDGGFGKKGDFLIIFKNQSTRQMWLAPGSDDVFANASLSSSIGGKAHESVVVDGDDNLYFFGSDRKFRKVGEGIISDLINDVVELINPTYVANVKGIYIEEYDEIWWSIPYGGDATANNKIIKYHCRDKRWRESDIEVSAFGSYSRQSGLDWASLPYDSWDEWGWEDWMTAEANIGYPIDLASDYDGYTYAVHGGQKDDGSSYTGYLVLGTDFTSGQFKDLVEYKRWDFSELYFRSGNEDDEVTIYVKEDGGDWNNAGTVSIYGEGDYIKVELPVDYRAKYFEVKLSATNMFKFLGMTFVFEKTGDR